MLTLRRASQPRELQIHRVDVVLVGAEVGRAKPHEVFRVRRVHQHSLPARAWSSGDLPTKSRTS